MNYNDILKRFVADGGYMGWAHNPFKSSEYGISTDGHIMCIMPVDKTDGIKDIEGYDISKVLSIIPEKQDVILSMPIAHLNDTVKPLALSNKYEACQCCNGEGEAEFTMWHDNEMYATYAECPICEGDGQIAIIDKVRIEILESRFAGYYIKKIIEVANEVGAESVDITYQIAANTPSIFTVKDIDFVLMPVVKNDHEEVIKLY